MSDDENDHDDIDLVKNDIPQGKAADNPKLYQDFIPKKVRDKFEIYSYRGAAAILAQSFPTQFCQIVDVLMRLGITRTMIRTLGGSKGPIAKHVDELFCVSAWRLAADRRDNSLSALGSVGSPRGAE